MAGRMISAGIGALWLALVGMNCQAATTQKRYYAHEAVEDRYGVIAPWYTGQNGQLDMRVRVAAETLKRYPWTDASKAVAAVPEYVFSGAWSITPEGAITIPKIDDWANGDLGQRAAYVLSGLVDYYRYSGDPAAIAHLTYTADALIDHCQTPPDNPWPGILISVPTKGKPYGKCDPKGFIQLDIVGEVGLPLLWAYQITGNQRWFETAKHWGDLFAEKRDRTPGVDPWGRYANPEDTPWKDNKQTGGVAFILYFLDELIRLGYTGKDSAIVEARDAGRAYLRDMLLPKWLTTDTWGRNYWDWPAGVQLENVTEFAARYMMDNKDYFPNWRADVRNILSLFLNHTSVDPNSAGEVYSGAWAYPESSGCCGRSLWYGPMEVAVAFAQYGVEADSEWGRELARRMQILATYDIHETGVSEDNIDGGQIVCGSWFKIAHPMALKHVLSTIGWLPECFAPSRENHIVRSTSTVSNVVYDKGLITYTTFDAPEGAVDVLRLAFRPGAVTADGTVLHSRPDLRANGYTAKLLPNGDCMLSIRHDGATKLAIKGDDPQQVIPADKLTYKGPWSIDTLRPVGSKVIHAADKAGSEVSCEFEGNQVRLIGDVGADGGLADVYVDGAKQLVGIDFWNPSERLNQVVCYKNGLSPGKHTLRVVARGEKNPRSRGTFLYPASAQYSSATGVAGYEPGSGPTEAQRWVFGCPKREDYVDSQGNKWRPATEFVVRLGGLVDSVEKSWWTTPAAEPIEGTKDADLYRYGVHAAEFVANFTVGPGTYHVRLKLAATRGIDTKTNRMDVSINGKAVVEGLDVAATAGGANKAVDLVFNGIAPKNGAIEVRFSGAPIITGDCVEHSEAFVQAVEVGPGEGGKGAVPVASRSQSVPENLLENPGFERAPAGKQGSSGARGSSSGWTYLFLSQTLSYIFPESAYSTHPDWGLPEFHCGREAIRTHADKDGHAQVYEEIAVKPGETYEASVWVRAVDLKGKGFGKAPDDSAGLKLDELGASGKIVAEHPKVELRDAGPYRRLAKTLTIGPHTARLRFALDTVIACPFAEGHVTYDDCALVRVQGR